MRDIQIVTVEAKIQKKILTLEENLRNARRALFDHRQKEAQKEIERHNADLLNKIKARLNFRFNSEVNYVHFKKHIDVLPKIILALTNNLKNLKIRNHGAKRRVIYFLCNLLGDRTSLTMLEGISEDILGERVTNISLIRTHWRCDKNRHNHDARTHTTIYNRNMVGMN